MADGHRPRFFGTFLVGGTMKSTQTARGVRKILRNGRDTYKSGKRSPRLQVECLEERLTPTVAFHPYFGSESTSFGSGEKLNSPPIEMIFWGATYWHSPTAASAGAIASAVSTMMSSPVW